MNLSAFPWLFSSVSLCFSCSDPSVRMLWVYVTVLSISTQSSGCRLKTRWSKGVYIPFMTEGLRGASPGLSAMPRIGHSTPGLVTSIPRTVNPVVSAEELPAEVCGLGKGWRIWRRWGRACCSSSSDSCLSLASCLFFVFNPLWVIFSLHRKPRWQEKMGIFIWTCLRTSHWDIVYSSSSEDGAIAAELAAY